MTKNECCNPRRSALHALNSKSCLLQNLPRPESRRSSKISQHPYRRGRFHTPARKPINILGARTCVASNNTTRGPHPELFELAVASEEDSEVSPQNLNPELSSTARSEGEWERIRHKQAELASQRAIAQCEDMSDADHPWIPWNGRII